MNRHHSRLIYLVCALIVAALPLAVHAAPARQDITPQPDVTEAPTDVPTEIPTDVPTEVPTDAPTEVPTDVPTAIPTDVPTEVPTAELPPPPMLVIAQTCTPNGVVFTITNQGGPMIEPSSFMLVLDGQTANPAPVTVSAPETTSGEGPARVIETPPPADTVTDDAIDSPVDNTAQPAPADNAADDAADAAGADEPVDVVQNEIEAVVVTTPVPVLPAQVWPNPLTLAPGESLTLAGGFGRPALYVDDMVSQPAEPCVNPPALSASAVCTFEQGVLFTITNSGGPMLSASAITIAPNPAITPDAPPALYDLLLGAGESVTLPGGYGQPTMTVADLSASVDEPCWSPAEVSGLVWEDANGDGVYGEGDAGLADVSVILLDDAGMTIAAVTDSAGRYSFPMLRGGSYTFSVDLTTLSADHVALAESAVRLDVLQGLTYTADFGFRVDASAQISGSVWLELTNWGARDAEDLPIATAQVALIDAAGEVVMVVPVDPETGAYTFTGLRAGDYLVRLVESSLFAPYGITYDADGDFNLETPIALTHGLIVDGIDFGVVGTY